MAALSDPDGDRFAYSPQFLARSAPNAIGVFPLARVSAEVTCAFCSAKPGTIRPDLPLPMPAPVCDGCYSNATADPQPGAADATVGVEPMGNATALARDEVPTAYNGPQCRDCGTPVQWFNTLNGKRIPMEIESHPLPMVPYASRWEITHRDTASRVRGVTVDGYVRVCHFDVCPERVRGTGPEYARMRAIWKQNGGGELRRRG